MNREQRQAILDALEDNGKTPEEVASIAERCDAYFGTVAFKPEVFDFLNATLRESWRDDHDGSVAEWDRSAIASGRTRLGRITLGEEE